MMDFGRWMAKQGQKEEDPPKVEEPPQENDPDERIYLECGCGKTEVVTRRALENGDTGWYVDPTWPEGRGLCGGQFCMP